MPYRKRFLQTIRVKALWDLSKICVEGDKEIGGEQIICINTDSVTR